jgi:[ribosomal protein S18]-alanine N-acetyltransferase
MPQILPVNIRWMIRRDMVAVLNIEWLSFFQPWAEEDFRDCLSQHNCAGMVAETNERIVGFMVYELHKSKLHVLNFAVDPEFRRQGVGSQMAANLVGKLSQQRRREIVLEVRESNLDAQRFFSSQSFRAVKVLHGLFMDTNEDAYVMRFSLDDELSWHEIANGVADVIESPTGVLL